MQRSNLIIIPFAIFCLLYCQNAWSEPANPDCSTPRAAIQSLLDWLQPEHFNAAKAATCIETSSGEESEVAELRARQILDILDARGAFVVLEDLSTDPNFVDSEGKAEVAMSPKLPSILVEKRNNRWIVSRETQVRVAELHEALMVVDLRRYARDLPAWMQSRKFRTGCLADFWSSRTDTRRIHNPYRRSLVLLRTSATLNAAAASRMGARTLESGW